ncbi:serine O-acetyltransferase [Qipengyuania sphaerica]|uniref:serine O-acetyltransferase n=1 Tax=Qipengyuania sphaerica TaxID=2867243 RepID=UPI001C88DB07|nr:DapH/DapD/GlmU-related protein [Qipengyuania sphaerica]MBX7540818.1 hypothetical protein [Qipengyuania sphaerica]
MANEIVRFHRLANVLGARKLAPVRAIYALLSRAFFTASIPVGLDLPRSTIFGHNGFGVIVNKRTRLGDNVFIGSHVVIGGQPDRDGAAAIGNDVVIHSGAKIFGPISIGDGAVIAANSVVTKDVVAGALVGGTPAKTLRECIDHRDFRPNAWKRNDLK